MSRAITCNICGKTFDFWDSNENYHIYKKLGYGTKYDGAIVEIDICCKCKEKIIDSCEIAPFVEQHYVERVPYLR